MLWLVLILLLAIGAAFGRGAAGARPPIRPTSARRDDPTALAQADPLDALVRYGTAADAFRLEEQGIDLGALGCRAHGEG